MGNDADGCLVPSRPILYSTPSPAAINDFVAAHYDLPTPLACTFLRRGFNDCFDLRAADGGRVILRLSGTRLRGEADVATETAFIADLDQAGIPVAAPIEARDGCLFTRMCLPQGQRPVVLFRFAEGTIPVAEPRDAWLQGETLARIHIAAEDFAGRDQGRYRNDLDGLLHAPLAALLALDFVGAEQRKALTDMARILARAVALSPLTWTQCHGDCHGGNARIATQGRHAGKAVFFDFDDGGFGYLAYDLAVFLWAQVDQAPLADGSMGGPNGRMGERGPFGGLAGRATRLFEILAARPVGSRPVARHRCGMTIGFSGPAERERSGTRF